MKKLCTLICLLMLLTSGSAMAQQPAAAETPAAADTAEYDARSIKVAIMPIIASGYSDVQSQLYRDLTKQMNLSLNKTLQQAVYLEGSPVMDAMAESGFAYNQNKETLKYTAELLDADVIVGYSVPAMYQHYYYGWIQRGEGPLLQSYIRLKLWAYYKPLDKFVILSNTQQYLDSISTAGMLPALASDASYTLTKKAGLKDLLKESIQIQKTQKGDTK